MAFNSLGNIIAPLAIISGCNATGNSVADGFVHIHGEVFEFRGGQASDTVIVKEDRDNRTFENGENKLVYGKRYATFGSSVQTTNYRWADFHRSISIKEIEKRLVHWGFIQDFYGHKEQIPRGWYLCDGTNGTPDLRGMFVVGYDDRDADYSSLAKKGGAKSVTLTEQQMPKHTHGGTTNSSGNHSHAFEQIHPYKGKDLGGGFKGGGNGFKTDNKMTASSGSHSHSLVIDKTGNSEAHENRPPYFVLMKIMYKGF